MLRETHLYTGVDHGYKHHQGQQQETRQVETQHEQGAGGIKRVRRSRILVGSLSPTTSLGACPASRAFCTALGASSSENSSISPEADCSILSSPRRALPARAHVGLCCNTVHSCSPHPPATLMGDQQPIMSQWRATEHLVNSVPLSDSRGAQAARENLFKSRLIILTYQHSWVDNRAKKQTW